MNRDPYFQMCIPQREQGSENQPQKRSFLRNNAHSVILQLFKYFFNCRNVWSNLAFLFFFTEYIHVQRVSSGSHVPVTNLNQVKIPFPARGNEQLTVGDWVSRCNLFLLIQLSSICNSIVTILIHFTRPFPQGHHQHHREYLRIIRKSQCGLG